VALVLTACSATSTSMISIAQNSKSASSDLRPPVINADIASQIDGALVTASAPLRGRDVLIGDSTGRIFVQRAGQAPDGLEPLAGLTGKIMSVVASADGTVVAAVSVGGDHAFGRVGGPLFIKTKIGLGAIGLDGSKTRVAFGADPVVVYNVSDGSIISEHEPLEEGASRDSGYQDLSFTADGTLVGINDGADAWEPASKTAVRLPINCSCLVSDVVMAANGSIAAFGTPDGHLTLIDALTGDVLADETVTVEHNDRVRAVAASVDGRLVIGVSQTGKSVLFNVPAREVKWRGQLTDFDVHKINFADQDRALLISEQGDVGDSGSSFGLISQMISLPD
jgi:PQQ-like domain